MWPSEWCEWKQVRYGRGADRGWEGKEGTHSFFLSILMRFSLYYFINIKLSEGLGLANSGERDRLMTGGNDQLLRSVIFCGQKSI